MYQREGQEPLLKGKMAFSGHHEDYCSDVMCSSRRRSHWD